MKIGVTSNIKITHKSVGMTNDEWEKNRKQFVEKYTYNLPIDLKPPIISGNKNVKLKKLPKVGVVIPTKGNVNLLTKCITSLFLKDSYPNIKVFVADTGSSDSEKKEIKNFIDKNQENIEIGFYEYDYYNFASINNDMVFNNIDEDVELILFSNNDVELLNNGISQMVNVFNTKKTHHGLGSYFNYHQQTKEVFGNTAAFMMVRKSTFKSLNGFNEEYNECFEDVELNIKCLNRRLKNYFLGEGVAYHYESQTRKKDPDKLKKESEDYVNRLIPAIIDNKQCYNYFSNITALQLRHLIHNKFKQQLT